MTELFAIGKLSKMTGVSTRSIRHYDKMGLLPCHTVTEANYRLYGEEELKILQQILLFKNLGFSLNEISEILTSNENVRIASMFEAKINGLDSEISRLSKSREMLSAMSNIYKHNGIAYINNFHVMKEMVTINTKFIRIYNRLDTQLQIKILKELYTTGTLSRDTLKAIGEDNGHLLLEELHLIMVKALLNGIDFETEKNIMMTLREEDHSFAEVAMKAMFTFDDIARLSDDTIRVWTEHCSDENLIIALKDSNNYLIDKVLSNMNEQRSERLRKEIYKEEFVSLEASFQSMNKLIDTLRQLEAEGKIIIERLN